MIYYFIVISMIIIVNIIFELIVTLSKSESSVSGSMITTGISLIVSAFPSFKGTIVGFLGQTIGNEASVPQTNILSIISGFVLIVFGIIYNKNIRDRIFILNMLGIFNQLEISDLQNIKNLKLADFKVKEILIDFVDVFSNGINNKSNKIIVDKIKNQCIKFSNRSKDFISCYTGMGPIPYTILAGTYLADSKVERYFEYRRSTTSYYEVKDKKFRKNKYPELNESFMQDKNVSSTDVIVSISITREVKSCDLVQFGDMDVINLYVQEPKDNIITSKEQLNDYKNKIVNCLEKIKDEYNHIETIHLLASIPSCISIEIGKIISLNSNRLPKIISYHYINSANPKYQFGIVVSENSSNNIKGTLIKCS